MSSSKSSLGPYVAPTYGTAPAKKEEKKDDTYIYPSSGESGPVYTTGSIVDTRNGRLIMIGLVVVLVVMFLLALAFCIAGAVRFKKPRYFALIINIVLSSLVTGLLIFWSFRGILASSMLWYVFVQCTFLIFQFITTDIFAWNERKGVVSIPMHNIGPSYNCSGNHTYPRFNCSHHHNY